MSGFRLQQETIDGGMRRPAKDRLLLHIAFLRPALSPFHESPRLLHLRPARVQLPVHVLLALGIRLAPGGPCEQQVEDRVLQPRLAAGPRRERPWIGPVHAQVSISHFVREKKVAEPVFFRRATLKVGCGQCPPNRGSRNVGQRLHIVPGRPPHRQHQRREQCHLRLIDHAFTWRL